MARKSPPLQVEVISGDRYLDLKTVQDMAIRSLAVDIADFMKCLQSDGVLVKDQGRIIPNCERMQKA